MCVISANRVMPENVEVRLAVRFRLIICEIHHWSEGPCVTEQVQYDVTVCVDVPALWVHFRFCISVSTISNHKCCVFNVKITHLVLLYWYQLRGRGQWVRFLEEKIYFPEVAYLVNVKLVYVKQLYVTNITVWKQRQY